MKKILISLLLLTLCFTTFTACETVGKKDSSLDAAIEYVDALYKRADEATPSSYSLISQASVEGKFYPIEWKAIVTDEGSTEVITITEGEGEVIVSFNEETDVDIHYTLTATVTIDGKSKSTVYNRYVPKFKENTFAEYAAAEKDATVVVAGYVTAIISKTYGDSYNCLYVQDVNNEGGYYIYSLANDPVVDGIQVGMKVRASGKKDIYNGTHEVKDAGIKVLDETITNVAPVDFTERYNTAAALTDESLVGPQAMLVTIKGVQLQPQSADDVSGGYFRFTNGTLSSYVRISSSVCPLNSDDTDAFKATFTANVGNKADVTGVICVYNGAFYLTPVDVNAYSNFVAVERTDAEKVAEDKKAIETAITAKADFVLDVEGGYGSTIAWAVEEADVTALTIGADGKSVTVVRGDAEVTVTLVATLTCGEASDTVKVIVTIPAADKTAPYSTIADFLALQDDLTTFYTLEGYVKNITNTTYGNFDLVDRTGTVYVYGLGATRMELKADGSGFQSVKVFASLGIKEGDYIRIEACSSSYNNSKQAAGAGLVKIIPAISAADFLALDDSNEAEYVLTGTVSNISNTTYGNFDLVDETGKVYVYGLAAHKMVLTEDNKWTNPKEFSSLGVIDGATITIIACKGSHNGNSQAVGAGLVEIAATDEQVVAAAKGSLEIPAEATSNLKLATAYDRATITWASSNEAAIAADGTVTRSDADVTVTLTATIVCGEVTDIASFSVIVKAIPVVSGEEVSLNASIADYITAETVQYSEIKLDDIVTMTITGGSNSGKSYSGDHIRVYATDSPAGTVTISAADGYVIKSVKVITVTGTYAFLQVDGNDTQDLSNVLVDVNAASITFNSVKNGSNGKQVRITAIEVVYAPAA